MTADQIIKYYGGELQAAAAIGKSHQTIKNWLSGGRIPHNTQQFIQSVTLGKLKADKQEQRA